MLILKVLNGPLFGAELALPDEACFIRIVGGDSHGLPPDVEEGLSVSANTPTLSIPLNGQSPNFTLVPSADDVDQNGISATVFDDENGAFEQTIALNVPVTIGALRLALRRVDQSWSDAVLRDRCDAPIAPPVVPVASGRRVKVAATLGVTLSCLVAVAVVALIWPFAVPASNALAWSAGVPGTAIEHQDGKRYLIVESASLTALARRRLQTMDLLGSVQVLSTDDAIERVKQGLDDLDIDYFMVRLKTPHRPSLTLRDALSEQDATKLRDVVGFADDFDIIVRTEQDAQNAARRLVADLGVNAAFTTAPDRFVVSINDYLSDTQLDALGRALARYHAMWGDRYAHFVVNQRDLVSIDGVKTGGFGYELRGNRHLLFRDQS